MFENIFARKKSVHKRMLEYGFDFINNKYLISRELLDGEFVLTVIIDGQGSVDTSLVEKDTGEEYVLYKTTAEGAFVGEIRTAIAELLQEIAEKCFISAVYKQPQTLRLIAHARDEYGDTPEFLWEKTPSNGILRRKDTGRWYAAILTVEKNRLGLSSDELTEIVNIHLPSGDVEGLLARREFYPAWHMNKKHWISVILDGSVADGELFSLVKTSYALAKK